MNKMKGQGMFQDRNMGKLPLHNKMGDYFPHQVDPNNPDIAMAGDVADETAQNMEGAAPRQSDYLTEDGRAIDANKPGAQMSEAGAQQIFGKKKYKIENTQSERSDYTPGYDVEVITVGKGPTTSKTIKPNSVKSDLNKTGLSDKAKAGVIAKPPVNESTKKSNKSTTTSIYTQNKKSGLYTNKKWDLGINYRKSTSDDQDAVTASITKYNKKGEVKKVISSDDYGSRKYKKIQKKKERILNRSRKGKRDLTPKEVKADNLKMKQLELNASKNNKMFRM